MTEVQGGNQAILTLIKLKTYQAKIVSPSYDCSEIARDLLEVGGKDVQLIYITPKIISPPQIIGEVHIPELHTNGQVICVSYTYHYVVRDKIYIYDPRLSLDPIRRKDYKALIEKFNPNGVTIQHEFIGQSGEVRRKLCKL
jgi:hypothetical protein